MLVHGCMLLHGAPVFTCVCVSVPCVPQQVAARVLCESGAVAVSWEPSKGALSYITVAQGSGGYASACNSSETTCLFNDLLCGLNYSIAVSASDERCSSAGSSAVELNTGGTELTAVVTATFRAAVSSVPVCL